MTRVPAPGVAAPRTLAFRAALALMSAGVLAAGAADAQRGGGPPYSMRGDQCVDTSGNPVDISLCKPQEAGTGPKAPPPQCKAGDKPCGQTCIPREAACPIK